MNINEAEVLSSKQIENVLDFKIIPILLHQHQLQELFSLRVTCNRLKDTISEVIAGWVRKKFLFPRNLSWSEAKLVLILSSQTQLNKAGGNLLFSGGLHNVGYLVHMWLFVDYVKDASTNTANLFVWDYKTALWKRVTQFRDLWFALDMLLKSLVFLSTADAGYVACLNKLFKMIDAVDRFHTVFKQNCPVEPKLLECTHLMPVQRKQILNLKEKILRPRLRTDFATFELPIEETIIHAAMDRAQGSYFDKMEKMEIDSEFHQLLIKLMSNDAEKIRYLHQLTGALFSGDLNAKKKVLLNLGQRNSGKTTFWELLKSKPLFAPYFLSIVDRSIMNNGAKSNHETEMKDFGGFAPILYVDEAPNKYSLNREKINRIVGAASSTIRIAHASEMQEISLKKFVVICANHAPEKTDPDTAAKIILMPFDSQFLPKTDINKRLHCYLEDKAFKSKFLVKQKNIEDVHLFVLTAAMLYWDDCSAIETEIPTALVETSRRFFGENPARSIAKRKAKHNADVAKFIRKRLKLKPLEDIDRNEDFTPSKALFEEFKCEFPNSSVVAATEFGKKLTCLIPRYKANTKRVVGHKTVKGYYVTLRSQSRKEKNGDKKKKRRISLETADYLGERDLRLLIE